MKHKNTMKKFFWSASLLIVLLYVTSCASAKENYEDILNTKDIKKIEAFLKNSHPEDPRRTVLKPKLIALKNEAWTKGKLTHKPMAPRPVITEIPNEVFNKKSSEAAEEFKKLMLENSTAHKDKTVKLLNQLFDNDPTNKEAIILVQNNSDCNMIMRIQGKDFYNMAIPAKGENTLIVKKGEYTFSSDICGSQYSSSKNIAKSIMIMLNNTVTKTRNAHNQTEAKAQK